VIAIFFGYDVMQQVEVAHYDGVTLRLDNYGDSPVFADIRDRIVKLKKPSEYSPEPGVVIMPQQVFSHYLPYDEGTWKMLLGVGHELGG
jgi:hypothetical protein